MHICATPHSLKTNKLVHYMYMYIMCIHYIYIYYIFDELFAQYCATAHRFETNKLAHCCMNDTLFNYIYIYIYIYILMLYIYDDIYQQAGAFLDDMICYVCMCVFVCV
jgi:hypothetical protein